MTEVNKQIAELLLKQTYSERMWFSDKYHNWLRAFYDTTGDFPSVVDLAETLQDFAESLKEE